MSADAAEAQRCELAQRVAEVVADCSAAILERYGGDVDRAAAVLASVIRNSA